MKRQIFIFMFFVLSTMFLGCATIINSPDQKIQISSEPSNAQVTVYEYNRVVSVRRTPTVVSLSRSDNRNRYRIEIEREGYEKEVYRFNTRKSGVSGWNMVPALIGVFPLLSEDGEYIGAGITLASMSLAAYTIDWISGANNNYTPTIIHARLRMTQAAREQAARELAAREQAAREQAAREQAAREDAARREQEAREQAARELAAREQAAREQAAREQAAREDAARREQEAREQAARELAARERAERFVQLRAEGLERATIEATMDAISNVPANSRVAIMFITATEEIVSDFIYESIDKTLSSAGLYPINKTELDNLRSSGQITLSGNHDRQRMAELVRSLDAHVIISGRVEMEGRTRRLSIIITDVSTLRDIDSGYSRF
jgi:hypothetical protein